MNETKKRILVCPLDWGLGHATRCTPLIKELIDQNAEVIIAAPAALNAFFRKAFPQLKIIPIEGYNVKYSAHWPLWFKIMCQLPRILTKVKRENKYLNEIIDQYKIDVVISDNRYGLHSKKAKCIFITHQLFIPSPFFKKTINCINHYFIGKYTCCWVPDWPGEQNLSGELSHGQHRLKNVAFIGPLSRFTEAKNKELYKYNYCILLSGPEPQRSLLEKLLLRHCESANVSIVFIRGKEGADKIECKNKLVEVHDFVHEQELKELLSNSEYVICRSAYSSIMDLAVLQKKVLFIPTPGQFEQEYLAAYLNKMFGNTILQQKTLKQTSFLENQLVFSTTRPFQFTHHNYLKQVVAQLLKN